MTARETGNRQPGAIGESADAPQHLRRVSGVIAFLAVARHRPTVHHRKIKGREVSDDEISVMFIAVSRNGERVHSAIAAWSPHVPACSLA
jgi:hypothetical protein